MSIEYYTIYALEKSPSLGETFQKKIGSCPHSVHDEIPWFPTCDHPGAGDVRPAKPEAELPGSLGTGLRWQAETTSSDGTCCELGQIIQTSYTLHTDIHEWYMNGN